MADLNAVNKKFCCIPTEQAYSRTSILSIQSLNINFEICYLGFPAYQKYKQKKKCVHIFLILFITHFSTYYNFFIFHNFLYRSEKTAILIFYNWLTCCVKYFNGSTLIFAGTNFRGWSHTFADDPHFPRNPKNFFH